MNIFRRKRDVAVVTSQAATSLDEAEDLHDKHATVFECPSKPAKRRTYFYSLRNSPPTADSLQQPKPAVIHSPMDIDQTLVTHTSPARRSFLGIKFAQDKHSTLRGKKSKGLIRRWQQDESSSGGSSNGNSSSEGDSDDTLATKEPREVERSTICDAASEQLPGYAGQDINCALLPPESASHQQAWMGSNMSGCHEDQGARCAVTSSVMAGAIAPAGSGVVGTQAGTGRVQRQQQQQQQQQWVGDSGSPVVHCNPGQPSSGLSALSGSGGQQRTLILNRKTTTAMVTATATATGGNASNSPTQLSKTPVAKSPLLNIGFRHRHHGHHSHQTSDLAGAASAKPTATAAGTHQTAHAKDKHRVHSDATYEGTGALSGILAPPPPSAHEQQKMDAWAADDDDVSNYEYDVSGAFFDMPSLPKVAGRDVGDRYALAAKVSGNRGSAKQQEQYPWHRRGRGRSSEGSSTASRLSSSSTVIESDELTAEQYKRIFVASARKLRWQKPRRGILGLMHIRNTMAHANAQFMECMGGERLDKYQQEIVSLNDMYTNEVSVPSANRRNGLYTPRSAGAQWRVHNAVPPSRPRKMPASQDQRAGTSSESGAGVDQSPIADSELLGFGSGDLVSLVPVRVGGQAPMYRPRRRRGAARRANYLMALPAIPVQ